VPAVTHPDDLNPETVDALLDVTWKLLDDERDRDTSFNTRAVGVAGFAGIIAALAASTSKDLLGASLESPWRAIATTVFVLAMVSLAATVLVVIQGVLRPRESLSLGAAEISRYPTWEFVGADKAMVQGRTLLGLTKALLRQRERNDKKASALKWAYRWLLVGLLAILLLGLSLGLRYANVFPTHKSKAGAGSSAAPEFDAV
jgi:hypothetical protein